VAKHLFQHLQQYPRHQTGLINLQEWQLPFIQKVWNQVEAAPEAFVPRAQRMFHADPFIICSPENNGGYAPAMKNLFDHFPKQKRKAFGIATSSDGRLGGMRAAQQLLQLVPALFGIASPFLLLVPEADKKFDESGNLVAPDFYKNIEDFVTEFVWLAEKIKG
jgi:NAD(P)H-dependent FMN reductase